MALAMPPNASAKQSTSTPLAKIVRPWCLSASPIGEGRTRRPFHGVAAGFAPLWLPGADGWLISPALGCSRETRNHVQRRRHAILIDVAPNE